MLKIKYITVFLSILLSLCFIQEAEAQYNIPKKPNFIPPIIDSTQTLSSSEYKLLYEKLKNYSDSTSTEILTIIISSTKGENIGLLAPRWGHKWEIGQKKEDNGVLILLAKDDRKIWIAPGYGVEEKLTAGINGEIIRNIIIPEFKQNNYYGGLNKGIDAIFDVLNGTYKGAKEVGSPSFPPQLFFILFIVFIF
ncbi:TPM domain-containing protein [Yeosuana marina]|uniref:TPM domain-containing protein n=1 Tax=Yeosuana marina TaxID=1565536 RepID=UPI0030C8AC42